MKFKTRLLTLLLAVVLAVSLTGCSSRDTSWIATVNGEKVPAGVYLSQMLNAYAGAYSMVEDPEKDVLKQTVDGVDATQWVLDESMESLKRYLLIEDLAAQVGLELSPEEQLYAQQMIDYQWMYYGLLYEQNGIAEGSLLLQMLNSLKEQAYFLYYYGEDGEAPISEEEILQYYEENYARSVHIAMPKVVDNVALDEVELEMQLLMVQGYYERLLAGESYEAIALEYAREQAGDDEDGLDETMIQGYYDNVFARENSKFSDKYVEEIFAAEVGVPVMFEDDNNYYVVVRRGLLQEYDEGPDEETRYTIMLELKGDEFQELLEQMTEDYVIEELNQDAYNRYQPKNIKY